MSNKQTLLFVNEDRRAFDWIGQLLPNFNIITAASPGEAVYHIGTSAPRFVLADSSMRGLTMLQEVAKTSSPSTTMIVFTKNNRDAKWAQDHGMLAIPKRSIPVALSETAETVQGEVPLSATFCN